MQMSLTWFGFNPSGWQTIIQQACLKTVEEESEKDKSAGLKNWEEGKENWIKKSVEISRVKKARRRIRTELVTNTSLGKLGKAMQSLASEHIWQQLSMQSCFK